MAAQGSGAAALNGPKGFELLKAEARSIPIQEAIAWRATSWQASHTLLSEIGCCGPRRGSRLGNK